MPLVWSRAIVILKLQITRAIIFGDFCCVWSICVGLSDLCTVLDSPEICDVTKLTFQPMRMSV